MTSHAALDARVNEVELRQLIEQRGFSVYRASQHFGCGESSILRRCARWGIAPKPSQRPVSAAVERVDQLRALIEAGVPLMRCAIELGCAPSTVARMCALYGLRPLRAPNRPRLSAATDTAKVVVAPVQPEHPKPRVECHAAAPGATPGVPFADFVDLYQSVYTGLAARELRGVA